VNRAIARSVRRAAGAVLIALAAAPCASFAQASAAPNASRAAVNRDFLIGSWSDEGNCATGVAFTADGTFATAEGDAGVWNLAGDSLTLTGAGGSRTVTIIPIDRDTMEVVGQDGGHDRSTRCAGDLGTVHFDAPRIA
jgi:hypothetical protein